jgi:peptidoglycan/LPS O-acetylase OafA/YrhL
MAERRGWLDALTPDLPRVWAPILCAIVVALAALAFVLVPRGREAIAPFAGGVHVEALALDVLENLFCVGASVTALVVFRARFPGNSRWARALGPDAYAVYVLHAPVIVFLALSARDIALGPWLKFALLTTLGVSACFALSHFVVRRLPLARKVF